MTAQTPENPSGLLCHCWTEKSLMEDNADPDSEIVRRLSCRAESQWAFERFKSPVARQHRVVVELEESKINASVDTQVKAASQFHRKARLSILHDEIEVRKYIDTLTYPGRVTCRAHKNVCEW